MISLTLLPEVEARKLVADRPLALRLLLPPYPAIGVGALRVLRAVESEGCVEFVAGYERYERRDPA